MNSPHVVYDCRLEGRSHQLRRSDSRPECCSECATSDPGAAVDGRQRWRPCTGRPRLRTAPTPSVPTPWCACSRLSTGDAPRAHLSRVPGVASRPMQLSKLSDTLCSALWAFRDAIGVGRPSASGSSGPAPKCPTRARFSVHPATAGERGSLGQPCIRGGGGLCAQEVCWPAALDGHKQRVGGFPCSWSLQTSARGSPRPSVYVAKDLYSASAIF